LLELLIYQSFDEEMVINHQMRIETPGTFIQTIPPDALKPNWQHDIEYCRFIGNEFLQNNKSLTLKVPSAVIPDEYNILVNPAPPAFGKCTLLSSGVFEFDTRLFK